MLPTKVQREVDIFFKEYMYCADFGVPQEGRHKIEDQEDVGYKYHGSLYLNVHENATVCELAYSPDSLFDMKYTSCTELVDNDSNDLDAVNDTDREDENGVDDPDDADADNYDASTNAKDGGTGCLQ